MDERRPVWLGPQGFEEICRALGVRILGPGITAFGAGPDGGREASFSGLQQFPNTAEPWNGYGIMQAKYKAQLRGTRTDTTWLRGRIKAELDAWADPAKRRVRDGRRPGACDGHAFRFSNISPGSANGRA